MTAAPSTAPSCGRHSDTLRAIAAHGLAGPMLALPDEPLGDEEWTALLAQVRRQRMQGMLWDAVAWGMLPTTGAQLDQAEDLQVSALTGVLMLERLLVETVELLESHQVQTRVLKGLASARLDYIDPSHRSFGDVDVMVRGKDFDVAKRLLTENGSERIYQEPRPGFDRRYGKGASFRTRDGLEIDLHRTFTMGPFGIRLDLDAVWEGQEKLEVNGTAMSALGAEERLLHACYHAVLGEVTPRLVPLRDIAQISLTRDLDLVRFFDLVRRSRAEPVVARAIRLAWQELDIADITVLSAWAEVVRVDPRAAADLAVYGANSSYTTKAIAAVRSLPTTADRISYVLALLAPQRSYLARRHRSRADRLRHGIRARSELRRAVQR